MRKIILASVLALSLSACANQAAQTTVANDVAAAEVALTVADQVALAYTSQPTADPATKARIKSLAQTAYNAVKAAERDSTMLAVALTAIQNLRAAVPAN
jgi:uncharacterized lipoprotein YehR (DUF1307 family)